MRRFLVALFLSWSPFLQAASQSFAFCFQRARIHSQAAAFQASASVSQCEDPSCSSPSSSAMASVFFLHGGILC